MQIENRIKILLINPPFHRIFKERRKWFPLGIYYLREYLNSFSALSAYAYNADNSDDSKKKLLSYKERYINSQFYDIETDSDIWLEIKNKIKSINPDIVGIYSFSESFASAIKVACITKEINQNIITILGGHHVECMLDEDKFLFDFCIAGEGEIEILKNIAMKFPEKEKSLNKELKSKYNCTFSNQIIEEVDRMPFPFSELDKSDINKDMKLPLLLTKGGCQLSCAYCMFSINANRKFRERSIDNVIAEIKSNKEKFDVSNYFIVDDTFTHKRAYVAEFCEKVKKLEFPISWSCTTHVNFIDENLLKLMKEAGCHSIHIGVETGNSDLLKKITKQTTIQHIREKAYLIKKANIKLKTFYMVGFPGETKSNIEESKNLIKELAAEEAMLHIYIPYPKTRLYKNMIDEYGFKSIDWKNFKRIDLKSYEYMGDDITENNFQQEIIDFFDFIEEYEKDQ